MQNAFSRYILALFTAILLFSCAVFTMNYYIDLLEHNSSSFRIKKTFLRAHKIDLYDRGFAETPYDAVLLGSSISVTRWWLMR